MTPGRTRELGGRVAEHAPRVEEVHIGYATRAPLAEPRDERRWHVRRHRRELGRVAQLVRRGLVGEHASAQPAAQRARAGPARRRRAAGPPSPRQLVRPRRARRRGTSSGSSAIPSPNRSLRATETIPGSSVCSRHRRSSGSSDAREQQRPRGGRGASWSRPPRGSSARTRPAQVDRRPPDEPCVAVRSAASAPSGASERPVDRHSVAARPGRRRGVGEASRDRGDVDVPDRSPGGLGRSNVASVRRPWTSRSSTSGRASRARARSSSSAATGRRDGPSLRRSATSSTRASCTSMAAPARELDEDAFGDIAVDADEPVGVLTVEVLARRSRPSTRLHAGDDGVGGADGGAELDRAGSEGARCATSSHRREGPAVASRRAGRRAARTTRRRADSRRGAVADPDASPVGRAAQLRQGPRRRPRVRRRRRHGVPRRGHPRHRAASSASTRSSRSRASSSRRSCSARRGTRARSGSGRSGHAARAGCSRRCSSCCASSGCSRWLAAPPGTYPGLRLDSLATLFYVANWHFILEGSSYFPAALAPSPLTHTWSLAIEEQFYLVWPLVVLGARQAAAGPPRRAPGRRTRPARSPRRRGWRGCTAAAATRRGSTTGPTPTR